MMADQKPHLKFFWNYWHVYKSPRITRANLIGAGKTPEEAINLYKEWEAKRNERTRKQRGKANSSRRQVRRNRRGR